MALKWQVSCLSLPRIGVMCTIMSAWQSVIVLEVRVSQNGSLLCSWFSPFSDEEQSGFQTPCPEEVEKPFLFFPEEQSFQKTAFPRRLLLMSH